MPVPPLGLTAALVMACLRVRTAACMRGLSLLHEENKFQIAEPASSGRGRVR